MADTNRPPTLDLLRALREAGHTSVGIVEDVRLTLSFVHDDVTYSCVLPVPGKGLNQKALKFPHVADVLDEATDDQRTKKFLDKIAEVERALKQFKAEHRSKASMEAHVAKLVARAEKTAAKAQAVKDKLNAALQAQEAGLEPED